MIPHIIHFCWFGKGEFPPLVRMCTDSWKEKLPDYRIMVWNEETFDVGQTTFTREAYEQKKWAFVSDYVRLKALYEYGGVYMDTDLQVLRDFSPLLERRPFVCSYIEGGLISMGLLAAAPRHPLIGRMRDYYDGRHFVNGDGSLNDTMNTLLFTKLVMQTYPFSLRGREFDGDDLHVYPLDYFMPYKKNTFTKYKYDLKSYRITEDTYTVHHDMGSWAEPGKIGKAVKGAVRFVLPDAVYNGMKIRRNEAALRKGGDEHGQSI